MKNKNLLKTILITLIIIGISIISFAGIYVSDKNSVKNLVPDYILTRELKGYREVRLETKKSESDSNEEENRSEKLNDYKKSKEIIEKRLSKLDVTDYIIRQDENNGNITVELPENEYTDQVVYELIYQGKFEIVDSDTNEVLMTNDDLDKVEAGYATNNSGYTSIYISFEFNKEGTKKFKNITNTFVKVENSNEQNSENEEENTTEQIKQISIKIDGQELLKTYFDKEISNGILQLTFGSSSTLTAEEMQDRLNEARNMSILLDNGKIPVEYSANENKYVASDITQNQINISIYIMVAISILVIAYMIIRFKILGIKSALSIIGYTAILLIALRIFNVEIGISGIFAIALSIVLDFALIIAILKTNKKENNIENALLKTIIKYCIIFVPSLIVAIVFTIVGISFGTVLFWGIFVNILYNLSLSKILLVDKN